MNENQLFVSVCMITYNHADFIAKAIEGVIMQQTSFHVEFIIGEDCSTDDTRKICLAYQAKYPEKIILKIHEANLGMTQNFVSTINSCTGKYIAICEGDDYWTDPYKLQKQIDFLEQNPDYGMICTDFAIINVEGVKIIDPHISAIRDRFISGYIFFDLLQGNFIPTLTVCFRKNAIEPLLPMMKNKLYIVDYWLWFHLSVIYKIEFLPLVTANYRIHSEGATSIKNIKEHLKKSGPIYYDVITYFKKKGKFTSDSKRERAILFRRCLTTARSKELSFKKQTHMLYLAVYYFSFNGLTDLFKKKLLSRGIHN